MGFTQRSTGTGGSSGSSDPGGSGGVVRKTPANNRAGNNPGGVSTSPAAAPNSRKGFPSGRNVVGIAGRTVAGTGKKIG